MAKETIKDAKNLVESMTPWGALALAFQINLGDWMYFLALIAAVLKDILDLIEFAGITYIVVIVVTFCISIFIGMMMILGSVMNGQGRVQQKIIRSWLTLLAGTTVEMLFGINILPIETMTVLIIWGFALSARRTASKSKKREEKEKEKQAKIEAQNAAEEDEGVMQQAA